eukprot:9471785-Pyramimonas_sp.AAC.1
MREGCAAGSAAISQPIHPAPSCQPQRALVQHRRTRAPAPIVARPMLDPGLVRAPSWPSQEVACTDRSGPGQERCGCCALLQQHFVEQHCRVIYACACSEAHGLK